MIRIRYFVLLLLTGSLLFLLSASVAASPPAKSRLVTFPNPGPDMLADLAGRGWDIWAVTPTQVIAQLTPNQVAALQAVGVATSPLASDAQTWAYFPQCYRTYEASVVQMQQWVDAYPDLAELIDAGPSWQTSQGQADRRLWALRLTNENGAAPKPKLLLVALHHAREIITSRVALNLAELLLTGYGRDADITWLVDNRDIWIIPYANPDGHIYAEDGINWRKNADNAQSSCADSHPPNSFGVDLNRNYDYKWGTIGASSAPCDLTYRGPSGFSEPETQAVRDLVQAQQFDLVISLHSFSDLILYPWGYTSAPAPDAARLQDIASVLASFNGYTPQQSSDLYPTSGDTCDWVYGATGIPCFTFEIGGATDGFFWPDCKAAHDQWIENRGALLYALKLAGDPYVMAQAPVVREVHLQHSGRQLMVQAVLDRKATSPEPPAGGEMFVDQMGAAGTGMRLQPSDQILDTAVESMTATIDLSGLAGRHTLYVVGIGDGGRHGPSAAVYFQPCPDVTADSQINVDDVMRIAAIWRTQAGDLEFDEALDLDGDGRIDVQDIGQLTTQWGMSCGDT